MLKNREDIISFIEEKIDYLRINRGILLLDDLSGEEMIMVMSETYMYPEIDAREIYFEEEKLLLFRYKIVGKSDKDSINEIKDAAYDAYHNCDYEASIRYFSLILAASQEPRAIYYAKLGFSYIRLCNYKTGIDYLKVATFLSNGEWDYTDYIKGVKMLDNYHNELFMKMEKELVRTRIS